MRLFGLIFLSLSFLPSFVMAQNLPPDSGLLITQVNNEQWQIRMIAGTTSQQFSGVIESDMPIMAAQSTRLENVDSVKLLTPTSLGTIFSVEPGGINGVNFSVSSNAKLCLRDAGSSGVHIYRGDNLKDAIPVTAPVALTSADACGDVLTAATDFSSSGRKFHAGQWIVMGEKQDSQALMATAVQPGVVGILKRYPWYSMESIEGVYNFSALKSDLAWAQAHGMRLIAMIGDKTFNGLKAGPLYLNAYEAKNKAGGYTIVRWNSTVVARYNALIKALGAQFDKNANFEGIATQESALSLDSASLKQFHYTPELYRDALISELSSASTSLPTSRVFWYMNFLVGGQQYIGNIASAVDSKGVIMGGPDDWPDNKSLQSVAYPYYTEFNGKMPLCIQVENVNYDEPHMTSGFKTKDWTMLELFDYAVNHLHVNYIFWVRVTKAANSAGYDWTDALPVIAAHPTFN